MGDVTYRNAYVASLALTGNGTFFDEDLSDAKKYPAAAKLGHGNKRSNSDMITGKLAALQFYELAIPAPKARKAVLIKKQHSGA